MTLDKSVIELKGETRPETMMRLTRWDKETMPSLEALRAALTGEGLVVSEWADAPGTVYPVHSHDYAETRWVVRGHLRVGLPDSGEEFVLKLGDRIDIPSGALHWIDLDGNEPAVCLIGTRVRNNGHGLKR